MFGLQHVQYFLSDSRFAFENKLSLYVEPSMKEMTVNEIEEVLGYKVKVVGD